MATAKDFRQAIAGCAKAATESQPSDYERRLSNFIALLSGHLHADEPATALTLWQVLHPGAPYPGTDGA
jgi:hypothetical protein